MAANPQQSPLSGFARALVQAGRLKEAEAESLLAQAAAKKTSLIEQVVSAKKATFLELARFAADKFGYPLLDLAAFDDAHIQKNAIDRKLIATHRVVPLHKRGNRLAIAIADPTNLRALDEIRFQTGLAVDPVIVEENKLATPGHQAVRIDRGDTAEFRQRGHQPRVHRRAGGRTRRMRTRRP
jgi:type IV pilus assembly protein PilB